MSDEREKISVPDAFKLAAEIVFSPGVIGIGASAAIGTLGAVMYNGGETVPGVMFMSVAALTTIDSICSDEMLSEVACVVAVGAKNRLKAGWSLLRKLMPLVAILSLGSELITA